MQTKKSLGQNFLKDQGILKKIADFAQIKNTDIVVEVGPGEGTLTGLLLERAQKVVAIEKDERMIAFLQKKFVEEILNDRLQIITGDILEIAKLEIENYILVGNIPYYITGALFKKFLENPPTSRPPQSITFVMQKEVAERIIAKDAKESILSISIKAYGIPEFGGIIKAGSFNPKPKVDSAILAIRNINKEKFNEINESRFFEILKAGFAHKRKLLIRNIAELSKNTSSKRSFESLDLKKIFKSCEITEKARAEDLKITDWICLTKNLL